MNSQEVAVLGGGHGAHCMAADLALAGHAVVIAELPDFKERLERVHQTRQIELSGIGRTGTATLSKVTFEIAEAVESATLLNVVVPAFGHRRFFEEIVPVLRDGQTVVVWAGDFGSLELLRLLREQRHDLKVDIVETNTLPYGTRLIGPGRVELLLAAPSVTAAAIPARANENALPSLQDLWPVIEHGSDVLGVALSNPNPIVHPPGSLLNTGRIEHSGGDFYLYREGITKAVRRVIRGVYNEMKRIAEAFGSSVVEYPETAFDTTHSIMGVAFQSPERTAEIIASVRGPSSIRDRYITEDLPFGLAPASQLAALADVDTPLIDAIVTLGSAICGEDFWSTGRSLATLGLEGKTADGIRQLVR